MPPSRPRAREGRTAKGIPMAIDGIQVASVYVSDPDLALAWYQDALGMEVRHDALFSGERRWIEVAPPGAATALALVHKHADWTPDRVGRSTGITLYAENVPATCQDLRDRGVTVTMGPTKFDWGWLAAFVDLDGNAFQLRGPA